MKKIALLLLSIASSAVGHAAAMRNDSIASVAEDSSKVVVYPTLQFPSTDADVNAAILSLNFGQANAVAKKQIVQAKRRRQSTAAYDRVADICQTGERGLRGVDRLTIVDSVVVDKQSFLSVYPTSDDIGTLVMSAKGDIVQFQTQINGIVFRPEYCESEGEDTLNIVRYFVENGRLTEAKSLDGLGVDGDVNYPFLMPDGQTFYFAARSSDGFGNYDLYATRYDGESQQFYQAENMGYPYNSYANDYMLVIDEAANIGWFASDRYQPADKVCVYRFVPNSSRQTIDYENTSLAEVVAAASLRSISAMVLTDEQKQVLAEARQRTKQLTVSGAKAQQRDFDFVVNDKNTYHWLADFTSAEAKKLCGDWLQKSRNLNTLNEQLQQLRDVSPSSVQQILNLEKRVVELKEEVHQLEKSIRLKELSQH